jgi:DNA topoisomerase-2
MEERRMRVVRLQDANDAGGRDGQRCTLILTQGDAAKTLAVTGLASVGRDRYGVFALHNVAQLRDVSDATLNQILSESSELDLVMRILGLSLDPNGLKRRMRYGHVMLMTNQVSASSPFPALLWSAHSNWAWGHCSAG